MSYFYSLSSNTAAWATGISTSNLDDGSAGDTSTGISQTSPAGFVPALMTLFYDAGSSQAINAIQFTMRNTPTGAPGSGGTWTLEGSDDSSSWTSIATGTGTITQNSTFQTYNPTGLSGSFRYYRLGINCPAGGGGSCTALVTDWRLTFGAGSAKGGQFLAFF